MSWVLDSSPEDAYRLLLDYLKLRGVVIVRSDSSSFIRGVFGSWSQMVLDNAKGVVKVTVADEDGGCSVGLGLSFASEFFAALVLTIVVGLLTYFIYGMLDLSSMWTLFVILVEAVIIWGIVGYSARLTKRKFMKEFNTFIQSHSAKQH